MLSAQRIDDGICGSQTELNVHLKRLCSETDADESSQQVPSASLSNVFSCEGMWGRVLLAVLVASQASLRPEEIQWHVLRRALDSRERTFGARLSVFRHFLAYRTSAVSNTWLRRSFKYLTLRIVSNAGQHHRGLCLGDTQVAAAAFADCLGPDPGLPELVREPLFPETQCLTILARHGCLTCADISGGRAAIVKHIRMMLSRGRSDDTVFALFDHFQLDIGEVESEVRNIVALALGNVTLGSSSVASPHRLMSLLSRQTVAWWALTSEQVAELIRTFRCVKDGGMLLNHFEAWNAPVAQERGEIIAALVSGQQQSSLEPARLLSGLIHHSISCGDLPGRGEAALQYVEALLKKKPRTAFQLAVTIAVHFGLARDEDMRTRLESSLLDALNTLTKNDRRAAERGVQALAAQPSLSQPPVNWPAATLAFRTGSSGPMQWKTWRLRTKVGSQLSVEVPRHFINTPEGLYQSVAVLVKAEVIGIDSEWVAGTQTLAIIQFALRERVYIWDLQELDHGDAREAMSRVLGAPNVRKLGFGFQLSDWPRLAPWSCVAFNVVDLDAVWLRLRPQEPLMGLKGLVAQVLNRRLDKTEQCSDWSIRPLSERQLDYAALDAHCLLLIWEVLNTKSRLVIEAVDLHRQPVGGVALDQHHSCDRDHSLKALDFRVGLVVEVGAVAGATRLWRCVVELGSFGKRQLVQGCQLLEGQRVLVPCNVVSRELYGVMSQGGVLVAYYGDGRREAVQPPSEVVLGTPLSEDPTLLPPPLDLGSKDNVWDLCRSQISTTEGGDVLFGSKMLCVNNQPLRVSGGAGAEFF